MLFQETVSPVDSQLGHHFPGFDGQYVVFREGCSPRHAETRLLTTPPSSTRVAECYLNVDQGFGLAPSCEVAPFCLGQCNVRIAQPISAILLAVVLHFKSLFTNHLLTTLRVTHHFRDSVSKEKGFARNRTEPNASQHELTTGMQQLCFFVCHSRINMSAT